MIVVYTNKITPRIRYIFKHIFTYHLGIPIEFTSDIIFFKEHQSYKISYHDSQIDDEFYINSSEILLISVFNKLSAALISGRFLSASANLPTWSCKNDNISL